jgi:hypothetical protein
MQFAFLIPFKGMTIPSLNDSVLPENRICRITASPLLR